jgi:hypothetical protein
MAAEVDLPTEERISDVVRGLGLERAHFAAREFQEFDGLVRAHSEIIASLTLVCTPGDTSPAQLETGLFLWRQRTERSYFARFDGNLAVGDAPLS